MEYTISMTRKVRACYKQAIKDKEFYSEMIAADPGNKGKKPNIFSREPDRLLFATTYYGWLVGKYGPECAKFDWW